MNSYTDFKAIYEKAAASVNANLYKLIYEKAGNIYGSVSGIPTANDYCFTDGVASESKAVETIEEPVAAEVTTVVIEEDAELETQAETQAETAAVEEAQEVVTATKSSHKAAKAAKANKTAAVEESAKPEEEITEVEE